MSEPKKSTVSASSILLGLVIGMGLGIAANLWLGPKDETLLWIADYIAYPIGQIFLRLLLMVVVPLVFCSLVLGVAGLGSTGRLGRIGGKTITYFILTTAVAATIGIALVNLIEPGEALSREKAAEIRAAFQKDADDKVEQGKSGTGFTIMTFVNFIPRNIVDACAKADMLAIIFFSLLVGIAAMGLTEPKRGAFLGFLEAFYDVCLVIIGFALRIAPYGVAGLIFVVTAKFGIDILSALGLYLVTVLGGLAIQQFLVLGFCVKVFGGISPLVFFRRIRLLMVTAFSTSSSNATLPTSIRTAQENLGVPPSIAGFVLPLGATMNMNGTALFEGVSILFLAQVAGIDLSAGQQVLVVILAILTAVGAAGVPGGSLPLITLVLAQVGIPPEMLAIILGVDRVVDMARTVPNVTGDLTAAVYIARTEGVLNFPPEPDRP